MQVGTLRLRDRTWPADSDGPENSILFQNRPKTKVKNKNETKQKASLRISEQMRQLTRNPGTSLLKQKGSPGLDRYAKLGSHFRKAILTTAQVPGPVPRAFASITFIFISLPTIPV